MNADTRGYRHRKAGRRGGNSRPLTDAERKAISIAARTAVESEAKQAGLTAEELAEQLRAKQADLNARYSIAGQPALSVRDNTPYAVGRDGKLQYYLTAKQAVEAVLEALKDGHGLTADGVLTVMKWCGRWLADEYTEAMHRDNQPPKSSLTAGENTVKIGYRTPFRIGGKGLMTPLSPDTEAFGRMCLEGLFS